MQHRPRLTPEEYQVLQDYRERHEGLKAECQAKGIDIADVKQYWFKGSQYSINAKGPGGTDYVKIIEDIVKAHVPHKPKPFKRHKDVCEKAVKATVTDMHVGLEPNPNGRALFSYEYNEDIFNENLEKVFTSIVKERDSHGKFDLLLLDDLGDGVDGWDSLTTRGGHKLDQNMTNPEMFRVFVEGKLRLIENIIDGDIANSILVRNIAYSNHGGSFEHIANTAIQMILNRTYDKSHVDFYIMTKFMEHFKYGNHTFILTHGKDDKHLKHGMPLNLDAKTINFINSYIEHYEINSKFIHVEKGDLHQVGYQRTKRFDYRNYMSFAPPSAWVQTNFGDTYSGYSVQVVPKQTNEISHTDYFFDLKKKL